jgi:hypothetical protein
MNDFQLYFRLGLDHILNWSSIDHILFLLALIIIFSLRDWRKLLYLVSLFTVAHTSSLLLSVYGVLQVDESLIETLILWTILITALSNIMINNPGKAVGFHYYFSFFFGLIHGLGFATDFKMMITGQSQKLFPLLSFAAGIETAQIILGTLILIIFMLFGKVLKINRKELYRLVSAVIIGYVLALITG